MGMGKQQLVVSVKTTQACQTCFTVNLKITVFPLSLCSLGTKQKYKRVPVFMFSFVHWL